NHADTVRIVSHQIRQNEIARHELRLARFAAAGGNDCFDRKRQRGCIKQAVGHRAPYSGAATAATILTIRFTISPLEQHARGRKFTMPADGSGYSEERHSMHCRLAAALVAFAASSAALAQSYPSKPIRIVVPYAAGGTSDILARQIGPKLTETWGQPVIVENKPGANGNVGAEFVAKSAPDGYTLLLTDVGGLVISPSVYPSLPFDPAKDFSAIVMVSY